MVEYITYKKKKYPVRVSYYALKMVKKETGKDFEKSATAAKGKDGVSFDVTIYEAMLYYALIAGAEAEEVEFNIDRKKIEFVLDECFMEFVDLMPKFFPDTDEDGKKKKPVKNRQIRRTGSLTVDNPKNINPGKK